MIIPTDPKDGLRPHHKNGPNRLTHCFYCHELLGHHKPDCVTQRRTVKIELKTWLVISVPQSWTEDDINFYLNNSSHCIGNEIEQLAEENQRVPGECCSCHRTESKYLGEATAEDHLGSNWLDKEHAKL
jgi:hypothetical protein